MTHWDEYGAVCKELAPVYAVPTEEWTEVKSEGKEKPTDAERVKRSIWYYFYEGYEDDPNIRPITDAMCYSCPVIKQCFEYATEGDRTGVHGGVYLLRGKIDEGKNSHKTPEDWDKLGELLDGQIR